LIGHDHLRFSADSAQIAESVITDDFISIAWRPATQYVTISSVNGVFFRERDAPISELKPNARGHQGAAQAVIVVTPNIEVDEHCRLPGS
jgi:hypothetical protein